jgi:hypothetical protein
LFTYYGKLKDEQIVAVLPKGTVRIDEPIHHYSQKQFISYRVRDVIVTDGPATSPSTTLRVKASVM